MKASRWMAAALAVLMAPMAAAAAPATEIAPGVWWVRGDYQPPRQPDGNSLLFAGPAGWLLVDTGRHPAHVAGLLEAARGQPVTDVLNTHWHLDHVSGNPALRAAHPGLVAHASLAIDGALAGFLADYRRQLAVLLAGTAGEVDKAAWRAELARIDQGAALRPDQPVTAPGSRRMAGRVFQLGLEADAVTGGDVWLYDPDSRVLAAGDLVTLPAPFFDTACPANWQAALRRLEALPFRVLVPGHGEPMDRPGFLRYRRAFDALLARAASDADADRCIEGWLADAGPLLTDDTARRQARDLLAYYLPTRLRPAACAAAADVGSADGAPPRGPT